MDDVLIDQISFTIVDIGVTIELLSENSDDNTDLILTLKTAQDQLESYLQK